MNQTGFNRLTLPNVAFNAHTCSHVHGEEEEEGGGCTRQTSFCSGRTGGLLKLKESGKQNCVC